MSKSKPPITSPETTYLRFLTSLLLEFPILIYLDDHLILKKLDFELFSKYIEVLSGTHYIKFVNGLTEEVLIEKRINLRPYSIFTYTLGYKHQSDTTVFHLYTIEENFRLCAPDKCFIRLNHLASFSNTVYVASSDTLTLPKNVAYGHSSRYLPLSPDTYTFSINDFESNSIVYNSPKFKLKPGRFYSLYLLEDNLQPSTHNLLLSIDGNSFLTNKSPRKLAQ